MAQQPWQVAATYLGTKFRHRGRSRWSLDCSGLLVVTGKELGHDVIDLKVYGREPYKDGLRQLLRQNVGDPVQVAPDIDIHDIQPNDILLMCHGQNEPSHLAIAYPHKHGVGIVHTYAEMGRVVMHRLDETWLAKVVEVYQWPAKS